MLACKATSFRGGNGFRHSPSPDDDFTWAIFDTGVALGAFIHINAELQRIHSLLLCWEVLVVRLKKLLPLDLLADIREKDRFSKRNDSLHGPILQAKSASWPPGCQPDSHVLGSLLSGGDNYSAPGGVAEAESR
jgi:hypothetical protein